MSASPATLTDRYVSAAMRSVPDHFRADLAAELRASIDDQVDARIANGEPAAQAERAVLVDLGDPDVLAAGYTDRPLQLIGPRYYLEWRRLLKLLLSIVLPIAVLGVALGQWLGGAPIGAIIGSTIGIGLTIAIHMAFWVTVAFALVERSPSFRDEHPLAPWTPERLPEPRPSGLGVVDCVASMVMLALLAAAAVWDQLVGFVRIDDRPLSLLSPALWPWWIAGLVAVIAAGIAFQLVLLRARRWTPALAVVNAVIALVVAVPALVLLAQGQLLNEAFFTALIPEDSATEVFRIVAAIAGFAIVVVAGWNIVDGILKSWRMSRPAASGTTDGS